MDEVYKRGQGAGLRDIKMRGFRWKYSYIDGGEEWERTLEYIVFKGAASKKLVPFCPTVYKTELLLAEIPLFVQSIRFTRSRIYKIICFFRKIVYNYIRELNPGGSHFLQNPNDKE